MVKVVQRSGLSQRGTYLPPAIHPQHTAEVSTAQRVAGCKVPSPGAYAVASTALPCLLALQALIWTLLQTVSTHGGRHHSTPSCLPASFQPSNHPCCLLFPPCPCPCPCPMQPINDMATALVEAKQVMTGAVEELLAKTGAPLGAFAAVPRADTWPVRSMQTTT